MSNDLVSVGAAPIVPLQPLPQAPGNLAERPAGDFSKALAAELENARAQSGGAASAVPTLAKIMAPYTSASATVNTPAAQALPAAPTPVAPRPATTPIVDTTESIYPAKPAPTLQAPGVAAPPPAPAAAPVAATAPVAAPASGGNQYTVQVGDSLSKIARRLGGDSGHWHKLYELNRSTVGANPDMIRPGQVLSLPGTWVAHAPAAQSAKLPTSAAPVAPVATTSQAAPVPVAAAANQAPAQVASAPAELGVAEAPQQAADPVENATVTQYAAFKAPADAHEAEEAIERISVAAPKAGSLVGAPPEASEAYENNVAAMHDALKLVPTDSPDYEHFKQTADNYEAAVNAAGRQNAAGAPNATPPLGRGLEAPGQGALPLPRTNDTPMPGISAAPAGVGAAAHVTDGNQVASSLSQGAQNSAALRSAEGPQNTTDAAPLLDGARPLENASNLPAPRAGANTPAPVATASAPPGEDLDAPPVGFL